MKILYFASFRERLGRGEEFWDEQASVDTVKDVVETLTARGGHWDEVFGKGTYLVSVDQEVASLDTLVTSSSEIAFFPPVTGG